MPPEPRPPTPKRPSQPSSIREGSEDTVQSGTGDVNAAGWPTNSTRQSSIRRDYGLCLTCNAVVYVD